MMQEYKNLSKEQINLLISRGCQAEEWNNVMAKEGFDPAMVSGCLFRGRVNLGRNVYIRNIGSHIANYTIEDGAVIENVSMLEVTGKSSFGNGVLAATVNEGGGREVPLLDCLTAQTAYIIAMYRHRPKTIEKLMAMAQEYAASTASEMGTVSAGARISNCGIIRNVKVGEGAVIEGATILSNGTINCSSAEPSFIGAGAKLYDFIILTGCEIEGGSLLRRCFVGEGVTVCGLTASDSLFFANSHFENGEVCSIFAGPFTVSHHKSSLLIAGIFSFFNAGSGSNQSNHLFKTGPVHQGVHRRGCKFGSDAYIVLPARTGAYTIVLGRHKCHHDTENFPYSYLMEEDGRSWLVPGINLTNYGTVRDLEKWHKRDKREHRRDDLINFEECNPVITEKIINAIDLSESLLAKDSDTYIYQGARIRQTMLRHGLALYRMAKDKFLGGMLASGPGRAAETLSEQGVSVDTSGSAGEISGHCGMARDASKHTYGVDGSAEYAGGWIDLAGMYIARAALANLLDGIDNGNITSLEAVGEILSGLHGRYGANARAWAIDRLGKELGRQPSREDIAEAILRGEQAAAHLGRLTEKDRNKDRDSSMSVGYGIDSEDENERLEDYRRVRDL